MWPGTVLRNTPEYCLTEIMGHVSWIVSIAKLATKFMVQNLFLDFTFFTLKLARACTILNLDSIHGLIVFIQTFNNILLFARLGE